MPAKPDEREAIAARCREYGIGAMTPQPNRDGESDLAAGAKAMREALDQGYDDETAFNCGLKWYGRTLEARLDDSDANGWQPIETIPPLNQGDRYIIHNDRGSFIGTWDADWHSPDGWWMIEDGKFYEHPLRGNEPTHWRPYPAPPAIKGTLDEQ